MSNSQIEMAGKILLKILDMKKSINFDINFKGEKWGTKPSNVKSEVVLETLKEIEELFLSFLKKQTEYDKAVDILLKWWKENK